MAHYQFSKHSYDKLQQLLKVIDEKLPLNDAETEEQLNFNILFPPDTELINKLRQHSPSNIRSRKSEIIEIEDGIHSDCETVLDTKVNDQRNEFDPINANLTKISENFEENLEDDIANVINLLKQIIATKEYDSFSEIIRDITQEKHLNKIFRELKDCNGLNLWKVILKSYNSKIVMVFSQVILSEHISSSNEEIPLILQEFVKKYPQELGYTLTNYLLNINEQNESREFIDSLSLLSENDKANILEPFINHSTQLNKSQLKIVCNLMHHKMDLLVMKNLLDLLSKNGAHLAPERNFGFLLESLITKSMKSLFPLREHLRKVINLIPGILKLKLLQMMKGLEQPNDSLSQTML